ncbi:MAG: YicC family protein [Pseudomonadales bacterium]|nr:YicC family protein [Pseudomonadales bacterium]
MPHSMTAFARASAQLPDCTLTWELRSVNHRFLEPHFRLPESLRELEMPLREALRARLARGKVDAILTLGENGETRELVIDQHRLDAYLQVCADLAARLPESAPLAPVALLALPGVVRTAAPDARARASAATAVFATALEALVAERAREGAQLARLIAERLERLDEEVARARSALPELLAAQRRKLRERIEELAVAIDRDRFEQELVYLAQRADVAEELDRLNTHCAEFRRVLGTSKPVGRRLDFLAQELNREANTLGAKSLGTATTQAAVEMKVLIEQIREQVQNLE